MFCPIIYNKFLYNISDNDFSSLNIKLEQPIIKLELHEEEECMFRVVVF